MFATCSDCFFNKCFTCFSTFLTLFDTSCSSPGIMAIGFRQLLLYYLVLTGRDLTDRLSKKSNIPEFESPMGRQRYKNPLRTLRYLLTPPRICTVGGVGALELVGHALREAARRGRLLLQVLLPITRKFSTLVFE